MGESDEKHYFLSKKERSLKILSVNFRDSNNYVHFNCILIELELEWTDHSLLTEIPIKQLLQQYSKHNPNPMNHQAFINLLPAIT